MGGPKQAFSNFKKTKSFLIGFDSDGCIFDTMEIKQKECFVPVTVWKWDLQSVSRFARECHEFVNLYSRWRGINRFPALVRTLELLAERKEAQARGFKLPEIQPLVDWMAKESAHTNSTLQKAVAGSGSAVLRRTLDWSEAVNQRVGETVYGVPPFPRVKELLQKMQQDCDAIVVSQTPTEALQREWDEHDISRYVQLICGQELGSKEQHLAQTGAGLYESANILVVGDAPGDLKAAKATKALFFPILPGCEEESWQRLVEEGYSRFISGTFAGAYQESLLVEMSRILPERPPWN